MVIFIVLQWQLILRISLFKKVSVFPILYKKPVHLVYMLLVMFCYLYSTWLCQIV